MNFAFRRKTGQATLNLASSPGYVAAVQLASRVYQDRPRLQIAQVLAGTQKTGWIWPCGRAA